MTFTKTHKENYTLQDKQLKIDLKNNTNLLYFIF